MGTGCPGSFGTHAARCRAKWGRPAQWHCEGYKQGPEYLRETQPCGSFGQPCSCFTSEHHGRPPGSSSQHPTFSFFLEKTSSSIIQESSEEAAIYAINEQ